MDIKSGNVGDWLVVGWFTPDYRQLAESFAANLSEQGAPFHLFAKGSLPGGWNTTRKPVVVLEAMETYPGKTIVLMDVDCIVGGDISPVTNIAGDVGLALKPRETRRSRVTLTVSSRVVVFKPTDLARAFAAAWAAECLAARRSNDELALVWTVVRYPTIPIGHLDQRYVGREVGTANHVDGIAIWHNSAHERERRRSLPFRVREWGKRIERRFFRTGATRAGIGRP